MARVYYGGQAVIEGVMMRGPRRMAVAVRDAAGRLVVHGEPIDGWLTRPGLMRWPLLRGVLLLADTLRLGMRALAFSVVVAARPPEAAPAAPAAPAGPTWKALVVPLSLAVGLLFVLPALLVGLLDGLIDSALVSNLLEGAIRLALLVGYLLVIGRLPEIGRVFAYHGAEHKTIHAYEAGADLTPAGVRRFGIAHPRCGTGFLLVIVLLSVVVFALLGRPPLALRLASRVLLLPLIAGIGYEYVRFTATYFHHRLVRWLAAPSLALQRLTTREPDDGMIEVAIAALQAVLVGAGAPDPGPTRAAGDAAHDRGAPAPLPLPDA